MKKGGGNFFVAHYDWLAVAVAAVALALSAVFLVNSLGEDGEARAQSEQRRIDMRKRADTGVTAADMTMHNTMLRSTKSIQPLAAIDPRGQSVLASGRRVFCANPECHAPILPDTTKVCPVCGSEQPDANAAPVNLDVDEDGLPDEWERRVGLNPNAQDADEDADGDGFTNMEEFVAGTNPKDGAEHPDYLDSLSVKQPPKTKSLPFYFRSYMKVPSGMKLEFVDPKKKNDYGKAGKVYSVFVGEDVGDTGYTLKAFEEKSVTKAVSGGSGAKRQIDVSFATIERKSDGKVVTVTISGKKPKFVDLDVEVELVYNRMGERTFTVVKGDTIELNGFKYVVSDIKVVGSAASVVLEDTLLGRKRTIGAGAERPPAVEPPAETEPLEQ